MPPRKVKTLNSMQELFVFNCYKSGESVLEISNAYDTQQKVILEVIERYEKLGKARPRHRAFKSSVKVENGKY